MIRLLLTPIHIAIGALILVAAGVGLVMIPAGTQLPVHWGFDLRPDTWQVREIALLAGPALAVTVGVLLALMRVYGKRGQSDAAVPVIRITFAAVLVVALLLEVAIVWNGIASARAAS